MSTLRRNVTGSWLSTAARAISGFFSNRTVLFLMGITILAFALFLFSIESFIVLSSFIAAFVMAAIGLSLLVLADRFLLRDVDTIEQLKEGNVAWGLALLGICIVIAASITAG